MTYSLVDHGAYDLIDELRVDSDNFTLQITQWIKAYIGLNITATKLDGRGIISWLIDQ